MDDKEFNKNNNININEDKSVEQKSDTQGLAIPQHIDNSLMVSDNIKLIIDNSVSANLLDADDINSEEFIASSPLQVLSEKKPKIVVPNQVYAEGNEYLNDLNFDGTIDVGEKKGLVMQGLDAPFDEFENKEAVEETIRELEIEKIEREKNRRRPLIFYILFWLFCPITLPYVLLKKLVEKIRLALSVKILLIYTLAFLAIIVGYSFFVFYLVKTNLVNDADPETLSSFKDLRAVSIALLVLVSIIFIIIIAVTTNILLKPIRQITHSITNISAQNLSARLEVIDRQDELMQLTHAINTTLDDIEQTFLRQQHFVSDASHELKTPISIIQGYSSLLTRWGMEKPDVLKEGIDTISTVSQNMARTVEQLLLLAKIGKFNITKTKFDLRAVLKTMLDNYIIVHPTKKFIFRSGYDVMLETDQNLLLECVRTLVDNAVKYTPDGGVITVKCIMRDDYIQIRVKDSGIGISREDLPKIFDRFYRCDKTRGRESGSSGLGLSIAKSIVDTLGGELTVRSELEKGSIFTITLF